MQLGDSITTGSSAGITDPAYMVGYRKFLWDALQSSGYLVDMVGSYNNGWLVANFDSDHEGEGGVSAKTVAGRIYQRLVDSQPHIVLLHLGTNDRLTSTIYIESILNEVDRYEANTGNPVTVVVARIIQQNPISDTVTQFNKNLSTLVSSRIQAGDNLRLVDMENALTYPDDLYNQLHPTAVGSEKMANVWKLELDSLLTTCVDTVAPGQPTGLTGIAAYTNRIDINWTASIDTDSGIAGYRIYRDGVEIGASVAENYVDNNGVAGTTYNYSVEAYDYAGNISAVSSTFSITTPLSDLILRINSGGSDYTDGNGDLWRADYGFNAGNVTTTTTSIAGTSDPGLYQSGRWDAEGGAELIYSYGLASGRYKITLHFAETYSPVFNVGGRVFDVAMEGIVLMAGVDIYAEAGANTALTKSVVLDVIDGALDIEFLHKVQNPAVRAIEIIRLGDAVPDIQAPTVPIGLTGSVNGTSQINLNWIASTDDVGIAGYRIYRDGIEIGTSIGPSYNDTGLTAVTSYVYTVAAYDLAGNISALSSGVSLTTDAVATSWRINAGGANYTDFSGNFWAADYGFNGGNVTTTTSSISGTGDSALYQSGRWDAEGGTELIYSYPLNSGRYSVTLLFAETYSGVFNVGARVFDVSMEGVVLMTGVDIYAEAGANTALKKSVVLDVIDGALDIEFLHKVQNPAVRGIEIIRIGDAVPDTQAPTVPTGLTGTVNGTSQINLSWIASTDDVGIAGYRIYRDGIEIGTSTTTSYIDTGLSAVTSYVFTVEAYDYSGNRSLQSGSITLTTDAVATSWRINAGGAAFIDSNGNGWAADYGYNGGLVTTTSNTISGTTDPALYQTGRFDLIDGVELIYSVGLPSGRYNVILHFVETYSGVFAVGGRVFDVAMEGSVVMPGVDIYAEAGANTALIKTVTVDVVDGSLDIEFLHKVENPAVRGIEIIRIGDVVADTQAPTVPTGLTGTVNGTSQINLSWTASTDNIGIAGYRIFRDGFEIGTSTTTSYIDTGLSAAINYIYTVDAYDYSGNSSLLSDFVSLTTDAVATIWRINAGGGAFTDGVGNVWAADNSYNGGLVTTTSNAISGTSAPALYQTGRFDVLGGAELIYSLPLGNGTYTITLHFAETYSKVFNVGGRVFDVAVEGNILLPGIDIYAEAGANTALTKTLTVTVVDGVLDIEFLHQVENPAIRAIEINLQP